MLVHFDLLPYRIFFRHMFYNSQPTSVSEGIPEDPEGRSSGGGHLESGR